MTDFFGDIPQIKYEGADSTNPLAFRHYNPDEIIGYWELGTNRVLCPNCADTDADVPFTKDEINQQ